MVLSGCLTPFRGNNMRDITIYPSRLQGRITLPSSKSHTLRAYVFAMMAEGVSKIYHPLISDDGTSMLRACSQLGARYQIENNLCSITGCAGRLSSPSDVIDCGNSGIAFRFLTAMASLLDTYTIFTGDASIRHLRPIEPLLKALKEQGVFAACSRHDGQAPVIIKGPITSGAVHVVGHDSQFVSALLILGAFVEGGLEIHVDSPSELPWIDLTCSWLDRLGIFYARSGYTLFKVEKKQSLQSFTYHVPGDFSSAAFSLVGALITQSELVVDNIDLSDTQGDKYIISLLSAMGARFEINAEQKTLKVLPSSELKGIDIDMDACIDALPILAVTGCFAQGKTRLYNAKGAQHKESNRILSIATELKKMGAHLEIHEDGLTLFPSQLSHAQLETYHDHRMVMALSVAALAAKGARLYDITSIKKSYPSFFEDLGKCGLKYQ